MCCEKLGPTFVKLGQLLATRPDLIPADYVDEFCKLHDQVPSLPFTEIEKVLVKHFGREWRNVFSSIEEQALGAASIAQVHRAKLLDGSPVVVKIQRPGIESVIREDMSILFFLAEMLERYFPEARPFNPVGIVEEFSKALSLETNFIIEANNIRRFQQNFAKEPHVKIPTVYGDYTGQKVLVMEALDGIPLSQPASLEQEGINPETILRHGLKAYLKMVFSDGLFHGDLHAGNLLVLKENKIGLIDFGVVGRLNNKTQTAIANMLLALAEEDYDRLAYLYVDLAPYNDQVDVDLFARDLRDLIAPYCGLTLKHVNLGKILLDSTFIAARQGLILPSELVLYFKSIVAVEGMGRMIVRDFDFMTFALESANELMRVRYDKTKIFKEASHVTRDLNSFISVLPRQLKQIFRRFNSPDWELKLSIKETEQLRRSIEKTGNLTFLGLVIAGLIVSSALFLQHQQGSWIFGLPLMSALSLGSAGVLGLIAFYNYIKKS
ncbi:MAG: AarF/ABC1/UbiB kinase family protein [Bdellovibrionales bacterium]|nr:AarF/ABC1/UbiB kinase family protein [Bdellovibrionales bacterium]